MNTETPSAAPVDSPATFPGLRRVARIVFTSFLATFLVSRILVILIMTRRLPDFFLHMGGTHVHHLNYGIFLLSALGGLLLFVPVNARERLGCAWAYGFALALTFDEFGMWLHLGGGYWQRASFDAVIVLLSFFGMVAFAPRLERMRAHHWIVGGAMIAVTILFYIMLFHSLSYADRKIGARLMHLEELGPQ